MLRFEENNDGYSLVSEMCDISTTHFDKIPKFHNCYMSGSNSSSFPRFSRCCGNILTEMNCKLLVEVPNDEKIN